MVTRHRSKTDQEGEGRKVGLPDGSQPLTCPVRSLRAWLEQAGVTHGPIFRYAGHGLRPGLATVTAEADVSERALMARTRHNSLPMVRRYIRAGSLFKKHAAAAVRL